MVFKLFKI